MAKNNAAALPACRRFLIWNAYRFILIYTRPWSRKMHFFRKNNDLLEQIFWTF